jgi:hypothetical protein
MQIDASLDSAFFSRLQRWPLVIPIPRRRGLQPRLKSLSASARSPYRPFAVSPHRRFAQSYRRARILTVLMQNHSHNFDGGITFEIELGIDDLVEKLVFGAV